MEGLGAGIGGPQERLVDPGAMGIAGELRGKSCLV